MATATPDQVRAGLVAVTSAAQADIQTVVVGADSPSAIRTALFVATPLVVAEYGNAAAALASEWYDALRDAAGASGAFVPTLVASVRDDYLMSTVAWSTQSLYDLEQAKPTTDAAAEVMQATNEAFARLLPEIQREVAAGFRDTITTSAIDDPESDGWRRYVTGAESCKFCLMLAARGAVYSEDTARFAAHTDCDCIAGPSFDPEAPRASAMQYVASRKTRSPEQRAALRDYLNEHFAAAPG